MTLASYPPARTVIAAHASHLARQEPAFPRWQVAAALIVRLTGDADGKHIDHNIGLPAAQRQHLAESYAQVLNRPDWTTIARAGLAGGDHGTGLRGPD
jgi:hypothetical protein